VCPTMTGMSINTSLFFRFIFFIVRRRAVYPARGQQVLQASSVLDGRDRGDQQKGLESFKKRHGGWHILSVVP
jgi:hypothetical protein